MEQGPNSTKFEKTIRCIRLNSDLKKSNLKVFFFFLSSEWDIWGLLKLISKCYGKPCKMFGSSRYINCCAHEKTLSITLKNNKGLEKEEEKNWEILKACTYRIISRAFSLSLSLSLVLSLSLSPLYYLVRFIDENISKKWYANWNTDMSHANGILNQTLCQKR